MNSYYNLNLIKDQNEINYFISFAREYFAPLLYNFSKWLEDELKKEGINKVFFLSRDGLILKETFEIINNNKIETEYFYASRRALIVPILYKLKKPEELFSLYKFDKKIYIKSFIKKIGLEDIEVDKYIKKNKIEYNLRYDIEKIKLNKNFLNDIFPIVKKNSEKEYKALLKYANEKKFVGKIAIVDIGWYGSMQNALNKVFPNNEIHGYYLGLNPASELYDSNLSKGFLFDKKHNKEYYDIFYNFMHVFEFLTLAHHGSVKNYTNKNNEVNFYDYEYKNTKEEEISYIIQKSSIEFIKENALNRKNIQFNINKFICYFMHPTIKSAKYFGQIKFKDDEYRAIAKPKNKLHYIIHPRELYKDFRLSSWKIGFLKQLLFFNIPYYKLVKVIKKKNRRSK